MESYVPFTLPEVIQYHQQRNRQPRESRMKSTEKRL
jgi:hypothetical protein